MTEQELEKFWKYLLSEAGVHDAWWLEDWLERCLEEYISELRRKKGDNAKDTG